MPKSQKYRFIKRYFWLESDLLYLIDEMRTYYVEIYCFQ